MSQLLRSLAGNIAFISGDVETGFIPVSILAIQGVVTLRLLYRNITKTSSHLFPILLPRFSPKLAYMWSSATIRNLRCQLLGRHCIPADLVVTSMNGASLYDKKTNPKIH